LTKLKAAAWASYLAAFDIDMADSPILSGFFTRKLPLRLLRKVSSVQPW
jgi:hypothetical protein